MATQPSRLALSILSLSLLLAAGCSSVPVALNTLARRGAAVEEVIEKKIEYRADLHEQRLAQKLAEGTHQLIVSADSRTFNRSKRFDLEVQWPVEVMLESRGQAGTYELKLRAREEYLKPDGMVANVDIEAPDGSRDSLDLEHSLGWHRARIETSQAGLYRAHVRVSAQNYATEICDIDLGSFSMLGVYREPPTEQAGDTKAEPAPAADAKVETDKGTNWRMVGIVVVAVNVFLMLLLLGGWLIMRRKNATDALILEDEEISA